MVDFTLNNMFLITDYRLGGAREILKSKPLSQNCGN